MNTKYEPNPSAARKASGTPAESPPDEPGSRETSATPTSASATPASWIAPGRSPRASPTVTGTTAAVAEIGAITPIAPTAMPR